jgi:hypothetical protein
MQPPLHTSGAVRGTSLAAIVIALISASTALSSPPRPKPHLRLLDATPLTLKGTHFRARERVRITVTTSETQTRTVRTARDGSFTTQFADVPLTRCSGLAVQAVGARGDRASLKVLQQPDCAPPLGP